MWFLILVLAAFTPSHSIMVPPDPETSFSGYSRSGNSELPLPRRRPALGSDLPYTPDDIQFVWTPAWPESNVHFGQVAAVTVDQHGQVIVFHRGSHVWNENTFDIMRNYLKKEDGPVNEDTVVVLDPQSGAVIKSWGKGIFFLPHGLTIDHEDNVWVTDVALHQIFKYPPLASLNEESKPLMVRGKRFENGKDDFHFCQPSAIAVMNNGDFFVSDGYCNSRILKFDKDGNILMQWGRNSFQGNYGRKPGPYQFFIPHALTLADDRNLVCVADRENGRVLCFDSRNGTFVSEISSSEFGTRLFSVAYSPVKGGLFYLVNGPDERAVKVKGFVVDANTLKVVSSFQTGESELSNPHDVAVSPDGNSVYVVQLDPHRALKFVPKSIYGQMSSSANDSRSTSADVTSPTTKPIESIKRTSGKPTTLNLVANSSFAKAIATPTVAISALMVVLLFLTGSGIIWCLRAKRRGRPPVLTFDLSDGFERSSLMHDDDE